jgi:hypothetical protein
VDDKNGKYEEINRVVGLPWGLDFVGRYAFVDLSQVRESVVFSGNTIVQIPRGDRFCGVRIIDMTAGNTFGLVKSMDDVREIYSLQIPNGLNSPQTLRENEKFASET